MNKKRLKQIFQQLLIVIVVFSLVFPVNLSAKRYKKGARLLVTKIDGQVIYGELLRVKENNLLLMTSAGKTGITINIYDIHKIRIKKKSKWWVGPVLTLSIGLIGGIAYREYFVFGAITFGVIIGVPVGALGLIIGSLSGIDTKIRVTPNKAEITKILKKLKKKTRFKN
jgi:hypothetical protein